MLAENLAHCKFTPLTWHDISSSSLNSKVCINSNSMYGLKVNNLGHNKLT